MKPTKLPIDGHNEIARNASAMSNCASTMGFQFPIFFQSNPHILAAKMPNRASEVHSRLLVAL